MYAFDPVTNVWTTRASMPTARLVVRAEVINGILYVVGGLGSSSTTLEAYNPATDTWTSLAPVPTARTHFATAVADGQL